MGFKKKGERVTFLKLILTTRYLTKKIKIIKKRIGRVGGNGRLRIPSFQSYYCLGVVWRRREATATNVLEKLPREKQTKRDEMSLFWVNKKWIRIAIESV